MSGSIDRVVVVGRDAALWLSVNVLHAALRPSGVAIAAVELPSLLGSADVHATLPALEALHNRLGIDEADLLRSTGGSFSLGQNFADCGGRRPAFLHAFGAYGAPIDGKDFIAYWLKARALGLPAEFEHFSLTAVAARNGRLLLPTDETEAFGRSDYGYHLPASAYAAHLKARAVQQGVAVHRSDAIRVEHSQAGGIASVNVDGNARIEGDLFVDVSGVGAALIGAAYGERRESWRAHFPADQLLIASGPRLSSLPAFAEIRAWNGGWTGIYPSQAATHVVQGFSSEACDAIDVAAKAAGVCGFPLNAVEVRGLEQGCRSLPWQGNCVALGDAACVFDAVHGVDLHAVQLGLVHLLSLFPRTGPYDAVRAEYNRIVRSAFERVRDFQSAHYVLNRYEGAFWDASRSAHASRELLHSIATFHARGEIAPWEDESFLPDSWRALFLGHGLIPDSYLPTIDRTPAEQVKEDFRRMLGFVKDQVLKQPTHDDYLARRCRYVPEAPARNV